MVILTFSFSTMLLRFWSLLLGLTADSMILFIAALLFSQTVALEKSSPAGADVILALLP